MAKGKMLLRNRTIKEQVFFSMTAVALLAIVILGSSIFFFSKRTIQKNFQAAHVYNVGVSSNIVQIQLDSIVELTRTLLLNTEFLDAVGGADSARAPYFNSVSGLEIEHAFRDLTFQNSYIENIMVVSKNGNVRFFSKMSTQSGNVNHYYEEGAALKEEWIETAVQAKGKEVFLGYNVLFDDANTTFSMVKELIVPGTGESVGYLVVNIRKTILDKAFAKKGENYATNSYMIVRREDYAEGEDAERNIVYFDGNEEYKDEIVEAYFDSDKASDYLFSSVQNSISGWEIVNVVEKRELSRDSSYIGWIALGLGVLMLLVCALLSMLISRAISSPLDMLEETIREVGNGNYRVDAEFDESEIGKIGSQFKNMVNVTIQNPLFKYEVWAS